jgi:hypothetical protein
MKKEPKLKAVLILEDNILHRKERYYRVLKESISSGS